MISKNHPNADGDTNRVLAKNLSYLEQGADTASKIVPNKCYYYYI